MANNMVFNVNKFTYRTMGWLQFIATMGSGGLAAKIVELMYNSFKTRSNTKPSEGMAKLSKLYGEMSILLGNTECDRVNIYVVENSGGRAVPGNPQYMTLLYEDFDKGLASTKSMFNRFLLDKSITQLLARVCVDGCVVVESPTVYGDEGKVYDTMTVRNMSFSQVYFLAQTETKSFFISISRTKGKYGDLPEVDRILIRMSVDKIRGIFKDNIKYLG